MTEEQNYLERFDRFQREIKATLAISSLKMTGPKTFDLVMPKETFTDAKLTIAWFRKFYDLIKECGLSLHYRFWPNDRCFSDGVIHFLLIPNPDLTQHYKERLAAFFSPNLISKEEATEAFQYLTQKGWTSQRFEEELQISAVTLCRFKKTITYATVETPANVMPTPIALAKPSESENEKEQNGKNPNVATAAPFPSFPTGTT